MYIKWQWKTILVGWGGPGVWGLRGILWHVVMFIFSLGEYQQYYPHNRPPRFTPFPSQLINGINNEVHKLIFWHPQTHYPGIISTKDIVHSWSSLIKEYKLLLSREKTLSTLKQASFPTCSIKNIVQMLIVFMNLLWRMELLDLMNLGGLSRILKEEVVYVTLTFDVKTATN